MRASCARHGASHPYVILRQDALLCRILDCLRLLLPGDVRPKGAAPMATDWLSDMTRLPASDADIVDALGSALTRR